MTQTLESGLRAIFELRHHFEQHRPRLIIMVARGTSDNAAQFGRYLIEITTAHSGLPGRAVHPDPV